jgi:hypothetical protein
VRRSLPPPGCELLGVALGGRRPEPRLCPVEAEPRKAAEDLVATGMLCLGYSDGRSVLIAFPGTIRGPRAKPRDEDVVLRHAVASRIDRISLTRKRGESGRTYPDEKPKPDVREKTKPFLHSYVVRDGRLVLCVHKQTANRNAVVRTLEIVCTMATKGGIVTEAALSDVLTTMNYAPAIPAASAELERARERDALRSAALEDDRHASAARISSVREKIDDVKLLMVENIEKVVQRGERLQELDASVAALEAQSLVFNVQSDGLRRSRWLRSVICRWVLVSLVVIGALIFLGSTAFVVAKYVVPLARG